jgi:hypothetical protein
MRLGRSPPNCSTVGAKIADFEPFWLISAAKIDKGAHDLVAKPLTPWRIMRYRPSFDGIVPL